MASDNLASPMLNMKVHGQMDFKMVMDRKLTLMEVTTHYILFLHKYFYELDMTQIIEFVLLKINKVPIPKASCVYYINKVLFMIFVENETENIYILSS